MNISLEEEEMEEELIDHTNVVNEGLMDQMAPAPIAETPDTEISKENELKSDDRLDRSSPDLWPQNMPSAAHQILTKNDSKTGESNLGIWVQATDGEPTNIMADELHRDTEAAVAGIPITMNVSLEEEEEMEEELIDHTNVVDEGLMDQMAPAPIADRPDTEISMEDELKSIERLDRSSPDLWPQNMPSAAHHILAKNASKTGESESNLGIWAQGLDPEDINLLHQFGSLTSSSLVEEVKKLQNIAYQLGLEESKEMTRGKLLHVLDEEDITTKKEKESHVQRLWK